jgi:hypothetical protein
MPGLHAAEAKHGGARRPELRPARYRAAHRQAYKILAVVDFFNPGYETKLAI